jgi:hypothetical protein
MPARLNPPFAVRLAEQTNQMSQNGDFIRKSGQKGDRYIHEQYYAAPSKKADRGGLPFCLVL